MLFNGQRVRHDQLACLPGFIKGQKGPTKSPMSVEKPLTMNSHLSFTELINMKFLFNLTLLASTPFLITNVHAECDEDPSACKSGSHTACKSSEECCDGTGCFGYAFFKVSTCMCEKIMLSKRKIISYSAMFFLPLLVYRPASPFLLVLKNGMIARMVWSVAMVWSAL